MSGPGTRTGFAALSSHMNDVLTAPVGEVHAIKRRVLPSGKVSFDAERNARGHADKFWAVVLACQKERTATGPRTGEIGARVLG